MICLDTHVVEWLYAGKIEKLSEKAYNLLNDNPIFISPIVRLELQYLYEIERITEKANMIVADLSDRIDLQVCDKNFINIISSAINYSWTRDPFDRIIVANADINNNILLTKDRNILDHYEKAVW